MIDDQGVGGVVWSVEVIAKGVRLRCLDPKPGEACERCDVKRLCGAAKG